jgi:hypothetical protein
MNVRLIEGLGMAGRAVEGGDMENSPNRCVAGDEVVMMSAAWQTVQRGGAGVLNEWHASG